MSNYVKATDFSVKDALVTGDPNKRIKGAEIDDEFDAIATAIGTKANTASPALSGTPTAPTATTGTNNTQIATTAFVQANGVPVGGIIMWGGLIVDIPSSWQLCDGTNSTPDLRDRFVVGAGTTYATSTTGGSKDAVVVAHNHSVTDAGHTHGMTYLEVTPPIDGDTSWAFDSQDGSSSTSAVRNTNVSATGITINSTGTSGTNANLPPYYALAYIQRIS